MLPSDWPQRLLAAEATAGGRIAQLCELCVDGLDCCAASVQLVGAAPHRFTVHATDLVAERLDDLQQELGEGPAVEVAHNARQVVEADLGGTGTARWPWFAPAAAALGVRAVVASPVQVGATTLGVLQLYRRRPGTPRYDELAEVAAVADAAAIVLLDNPVISSAEALVWLITDSTRFRPEVHQATGMLIVQLHLSAVDAFATLCAAAYATDRPVAAVAREIVARRLRLDER